jgi:hypothetical protein
MKKLLTLLALLVGFVSPAFAQITFDENGNSNPSLNFSVATDPLTGVHTLEYTFLDSSITTGDLRLTEPGTGDSDLLRFEQPNGPGTFVKLFVYSLTDDGVDSLADTVATLPSLQATQLTLAETGTEAGPNGIFPYTPTAGEPGFDTSHEFQNYNFISDPAVPEASTWLAAALAAGLLTVQVVRAKALNKRLERRCS